MWQHGVFRKQGEGFENQLLATPGSLSPNIYFLLKIITYNDISVKTNCKKSGYIKCPEQIILHKTEADWWLPEAGGEEGREKLLKG